MIPLTRLRFFLVIFALAGFVSGFSGCVNLEKKFPDIQTYSLEAPRGQHVTFEGKPVSVRLSMFSAIPAFSDRYLTYRTDETTYEQDFYNQLMADPARMVQDQVLERLKSSPLVSYVLPTDAAGKAEYLIEGKLLDLSGDYRDEHKAKAVFEIQLTVNRMVSGTPRVLFQKVYSSEVPINRPSPKMLTAGWNLGFGQVMADFEKDFKGLIEKPVRP